MPCAKSGGAGHCDTVGVWQQLILQMIVVYTSRLLHNSHSYVHPVGARLAQAQCGHFAGAKVVFAFGAPQPVALRFVRFQAQHRKTVQIWVLNILRPDHMRAVQQDRQRRRARSGRLTDAAGASRALGASTNLRETTYGCQDRSCSKAIKSSPTRAPSQRVVPTTSAINQPVLACWAWHQQAHACMVFRQGAAHRQWLVARPNSRQQGHLAWGLPPRAASKNGRG